MKRDNKYKKRYLLALGILPILFISIFFNPAMNGYSLTEHSAARYTYPNQEGKIVYERVIDNKKVVIWDTGGVKKYTKVIEKHLGFLYRVSKIDTIDSGYSADKQMNITWGGTLIEDTDNYNVIFAAEVLDNEIETVIVSNAREDEENKPLSFVRENSSVFVEMDVHNGFAVELRELPIGDVGGYKFRGLNSEGEMVIYYY